METWSSPDGAQLACWWRRWPVLPISFAALTRFCGLQSEACTCFVRDWQVGFFVLFCFELGNGELLQMIV